MLSHQKFLPVAAVNKYRDPQLDNIQRERPTTLSLKRDVSSNPSLQGSENYVQEKVESVRASRDRRHEGNKAF